MFTDSNVQNFVNVDHGSALSTLGATTIFLFIVTIVIKNNISIFYQAGYRVSNIINGFIHWHDPITHQPLDFSLVAMFNHDFCLQKCAIHNMHYGLHDLDVSMLLEIEVLSFDMQHYHVYKLILEGALTLRDFQISEFLI